MHPDAQRAHADRWLRAWNEHDLDAILDCYSDDVEFIASTVATRWGIEDGVIRGKDLLRRHFYKGLELAPALVFEEEALFASPSGYALLYRRNDGRRVIDTVELDNEGRALRAHACYLAPPSSLRGLDGRRFAPVALSEGSETDQSTVFEYHERAGLIWASYQGARIQRGYLVGTRAGDRLAFRYSQVATDGETASGVCSSKITELDDGGLRLEESWRWETKPGSGTSVLEEMRTR